MAKKQTADDKDDLVKALKDVDVPDETADEPAENDTATADADDEGTEEETPVAKPKTKGGSKKTPKNGKKTSADVTPPSSTIKKPADDGSKKRKRNALILAGIGVVLIVVAAVGYFMIGRSTDTDSPTNTVNTNTASGLVPRRIDGVLDKAENQNKYPVAIMVENLVASRPQSGLDRANIVYEALAEGGITRFMALYTFANSAKEIGPVRSARPYYVDWARGYNAMYVHIGGSPKAYARISSTGVMDFDQFHNSQYFWRDKTRDVASEHTLYTSDYLMTLALLDKKVAATGDYTAWKYKDDAVSADRPSSQHITVNFSSFSYKVDYEYDPVNNVYVRSVAEKAHVMRDGTQLQPKNVVVLTVNRRLETPTTDNKGRLEMDTIGQGTAQFFLDGTVVKGTWKKDSSEAPLQLLAEDGSHVSLNAGQTWVEIVPPDQTVTVT